MSFKYLTNEGLESARESYIKTLKENGFKSSSETAELCESCGRFTAKAVYAEMNAPHYPASAMDGIAIRAELSFGASETEPVILKPDQFTAVDTGDPIPCGCDAVIMIEDVIYQDDGGAMLISPATPYQHIRQIGEDICRHEMIIPSRSKISPAAIGAMLAGGVLKAELIKAPVVGIIPTGDEVVPPSARPKPGDVIEFNSSIFSSMLKGWGAKAICYPIVKDKKELIIKALKKALKECDIVILNAGSSAGRDDYSCEAIESVGEVLCHGLAIKPGKPAILAAAGPKPVIGVPGYPVSGIIILEEILKPLIELWYQSKIEGEEYREAVLSRAVVSGLKYEEFIRVRLGCVNGKLVASPLNRGAGVVSSFMKADGIMKLPQNSEGFEAGRKVNIRLLRPMSELSKTIVAIGSHDPLLDELCDLIHISDPSLYMSSSHVGSMGGITAAKRGESHIGGVHLLNEKDGSYNEAFIEKYFPEGGVRLIECVGRTQGIMVAKGNPLSIKGIEDLAENGLRYVNRQKGSGTRILTDYLLKSVGAKPENIYGYDREEFTHNAVATQIASGTADAGMGIFAAAKIYGLEFIPVCSEQYDLLVPDYAWENEAVQRLLEILASEQFRSRLEKLGGYSLDRPGRVRRRFT